eukprot:m.59885 g.59885  ORF g.59885 m.59885 type:complete len:265 (+) comp34905_c0_seq2:645-1439(+)
MNSSSFLQPMWDYICYNFGGFLASPFFPICWGMGLYISICLVYLVFDLAGPRWSFIHQYKIQPRVQLTRKDLKKVLLRSLKNNVFFILPFSIIQGFAAEPLCLPEEAPSVGELAFHLTICFVVYDTEYFMWHFAHHRVRFLYKHFHALHHEVKSPHAFASQYLHPFEFFCSSLFMVSTPLLLGVHPLTNWIWMACGVFISVEDHSGYDFPLSLKWVLPFGIYGGAPHHDMHHCRPNTNFQPFFTWWDRLLGTAYTPDPAKKWKD